VVALVEVYDSVSYRETDQKMVLVRFVSQIRIFQLSIRAGKAPLTRKTRLEMQADCRGQQRSVNGCSIGLSFHRTSRACAISIFFCSSFPARAGIKVRGYTFQGSFFFFMCFLHVNC